MILMKILLALVAAFSLSACSALPPLGTSSNTLSQSFVPFLGSGSTAARKTATPASSEITAARPSSGVLPDDRRSCGTMRSGGTDFDSDASTCAGNA
ncbi:MAG: hypothetical protein AAGB05_04945 [Pseudomonadota bacterium]